MLQEVWYWYEENCPFREAHIKKAQPCLINIIQHLKASLQWYIMDCIFVKRDFMIVNSNDINNVKNDCIDLQCSHNLQERCIFSGVLSLAL